MDLATLAMKPISGTFCGQGETVWVTGDATSPRCNEWVLCLHGFPSDNRDIGVLCPTHTPGVIKMGSA